MAPNRGLKEEEDYPSSDNDSFKSFEPDSPTITPSKPSTQTPTKDSKTTTDINKEATQPGEKKEQDENQDQEEDQPQNPNHRFPPDEEASLLSQSAAEKQKANTLFSTGSYDNAIQTYDRALALCPNYLDYEIAVLRANISACNLKLEAWKESLDAATQGIECLERLEKLPVPPAPSRKGKEETAGGEGEGAIEEVDDDLEARIENLRASGHTLAEQNGWANLQGADEDYRVLLSPGMEGFLAPTDKKSVLENARALAPRLNRAKEEEMAEMMGKLKGLGNSFLKPFGLSTENFKFEQDAKTGGYSMNFEQNPGKK
ncbi:hypothetical protein Q7P37_007101 [Cladosporium fusiforme]